MKGNYFNMAKATITKIEFNQKKVAKSGATFDGAILSARTEAGAFKKEFIFQKSDIFQVLSSLSAGDVVDLVYEKKGDFFNLKDIKPTGEKGAAPVATTSASTSSSGGKSSSGGWTPRYSDSEEYTKHKDLMIIKQSAMKAAVDTVAAMLAKDMFKKTATVDFIAEEVMRLASKFESNITGEDAKAELASSVATLDTSGSVEYDDDCPFPQ